MSGDHSRDSFDALRDFAAVFLQQGRAVLDADWNELVEIFERRIRAGTVDTIGRAVVPRETEDGFEIRIAGTGIEIGRGRMYLDGMLIECHGSANFTGTEPALPDPVFDRAREGDAGPEGVLDEMISPEAGDFVSYDAQPYWPVPDPLPGEDAVHLAYVVAWQREVTPAENPDLLEPALGGIDTTTRWQTVWQVRLLADVGDDATCATPEAELAGWTELVAPSTARLTTATIDVEDPEDPCLVPPTDGYTGVENQLYRVEIHAVGDTQADARFKFSRENASVVTSIEAFGSPTAVSVGRIGRDDNLSIEEGDWVELTDDRRELAHRSGKMLRVSVVHAETREIEFEAAIDADPADADLIPSGVGDDTPAARRSRLIRWDQSGIVRLADNSEWTNLDAPGSDGLIPVPPDGSAVLLEFGHHRRLLHRRRPRPLSRDGPLAVRRPHRRDPDRDAARRPARGHPAPLRPPRHRALPGRGARLPDLLATRVRGRMLRLHRLRHPREPRFRHAHHPRRDRPDRPRRRHRLPRRRRLPARRATAGRRSQCHRDRRPGHGDRAPLPRRRRGAARPGLGRREPRAIQPAGAAAGGPTPA